MGWKFPWVSSYGTTFNDDFRSNLARVYEEDKGEYTAFSTFIMGDGKGVGEKGKVYYKYSTYNRGTELHNNTFVMLDMTHLGRQDENAKAAGIGFKFHDEYSAQDIHPQS